MGDPQDTPLAMGQLKTRPEFLYVARGARTARDGVVVQAAASDLAGPGVRAGFTATKKIGGAVIRNRAKRRLRAAARQALPELGRPGCDYVFIARGATAARAWPALLDDVQSALISLARRLEKDVRGPVPEERIHNG